MITKLLAILAIIGNILADHDCMNSNNVEINIEKNFDYRVEGYNRYFLLQIDPAKTCNLIFDEYSTYSRIYAIGPEDAGQKPIGSDLIVTWDKYIWAGESCIYNNSGEGIFEGEMTNIEKMLDPDKPYGSFCQIEFFIRARTCLDGCPDEERQVVFYTFEKEIIPFKSRFANTVNLLRMLFFYAQTTPLGFFMGFFFNDWTFL